MSLREEFDKRRMDYVKNYSEANNLDAYSVIWYADEVISHQEVIISQERQAKEELLGAIKRAYNNWEGTCYILFKQLIDKHTGKDKEK